MRPVVVVGHQPCKSEEEQVPPYDDNDWMVVNFGVEQNGCVAVNCHVGMLVVLLSADSEDFVKRTIRLFISTDKQSQSTSYPFKPNYS